MGTPIDVGSLVTTKLKIFARDIQLGVATGFFCERNKQIYLVTNWHVVTGRNFQTREVLNDKGALPDRIEYLVPVKGYDGEWMNASSLLYDNANETRTPSKSIWVEHSVHHNKIDVVGIPVTIPEGGTAHTIDRVDTVPKLLLTISRDVFVLGYPKGIDGGRGFPIWKRASIATEPHIALDGLPKMLVDTSTRDGMSGSPVIAIADGDFDVEGQQPAYRNPGRVYRFVGVYSGRLGKGEMEAQLGIVWRERALYDILDAPAKGKSSFEL